MGLFGHVAGCGVLPVGSCRFQPSEPVVPGATGRSKGVEPSNIPACTRCWRQHIAWASEPITRTDSLGGSEESSYHRACG